MISTTSCSAGVLGKIEFDDDGEITNAGAIVAEMKQSKAHLFAGVNTTSG